MEASARFDALPGVSFTDALRRAQSHYLQSTAMRRPILHSCHAIPVTDVLEMLVSGVSESEILAEFPDLPREDIRARLYFAGKRSRIVRLAA